MNQVFAIFELSDRDPVRFLLKDLLENPKKLYKVYLLVYFSMEFPTFRNQAGRKIDCGKWTDIGINIFCTVYATCINNIPNQCRLNAGSPAVT